MYKEKKILAIIPARGGSKGLPGKNIKPLQGKPLICYTIDLIRQFLCDKDICVSTDDLEIKKVVEDYGLNVPFIRPEHLSTDTATSHDVLMHALEYYESVGKDYDTIVLLQPTSPLRTIKNMHESFDIYFNENIDLLVSVVKSSVSAVLSKEDCNGNLQLVYNTLGNRRQDAEALYEYNGAIYIVKVAALKNAQLHAIKNRKKYVMSKYESIDIDDIYDFKLIEILINQ